MPAPTASVQRSFRLTQRTAELLDACAEAGSETRNSLVERILAEALRTERHPLIRFRQGAAGRREPMRVGTRLLVRQVIATVRGSEDAADAAESLSVPRYLVEAAIAYYAEFSVEASWAEHFAEAELVNWMQQRNSTGMRSPTRHCWTHAGGPRRSW